MWRVTSGGRRSSGLAARCVLEAAALFLYAVCEFFDDGVGEDFAGDALDLGAGGLGGSRPSARDKSEILALADGGDLVAKPILRRALWMVWPCGSRTDVFNVT